jgi:hypothetical protein
MAYCERGYLCDVCGGDVESIIESDLYLRYVLGEVSPEELDTRCERHIRCNPTMAQFIVDAHFEPVRCDGAFGKEQLDSEYVAAEEARVTRGWRRLQELPALGLPLTLYPLPEVLEARNRSSTGEREESPERGKTEYAERMHNYLEGLTEMRIQRD